MPMNFECLKVALKQDRTGFVLTLKIHPDEIPEALIRDFVGARYGCALVRINDDETPVVYNDRVTRAATLCKDKKFQNFLGVFNEDKAVATIYKYCQISSRSELNGNKKAQDLFDNLFAAYQESQNDPF
jgi:hypothetical protein